MRYFNLFSNIVVTKGPTRILISDLQRNVSELYPLELYECLEELKHNALEDIVKKYDDESQPFIQEYVDLLLEKEYGFITENSWDEQFPPISYEYDEPSLLTEIFIDLSDISILKNIRMSVENLRIKHLVIYSQKKLAAQDFIEIDAIFAASVACGIEIYAPFHKEVDQLFIHTLHENTERIYQIVYYNCERKAFKIKDEFRFRVHFVEEEMKISSCGKVDLKYFNTNLPKVSEALNYNSCLHKKIGIDYNGNIKNCPLMADHFGNINDVSLEEALMKPGFKKYWTITKEKIEVCRDCEFRYICTDCRAYTERTHQDTNGSDLSKPLKCGYDPYTGQWEAWSENPLKQQALHFYTQQLKT